MADSKYNCFDDRGFMDEVSRLGRGFPVSEWLDETYFPDEDETRLTPSVIDAEGVGYFVEVNRNKVHLKPIAKWRFEIDPSTRHRVVKRYRKVS